MIVGWSISGARAIGVCSSRSARFASQTIVGRSSHRQKSMSPSLRPDQTGAVAHPVRPVRRAALLVEELLLDAVRIALQRQRPRPQVRQQHRRDPRVVVDHVALREPGARVHQLVEVRERERRLADVDLEALGWGTV